MRLLLSCMLLVGCVRGSDCPTKPPTKIGNRNCDDFTVVGSFSRSMTFSEDLAKNMEVFKVARRFHDPYNSKNHIKKMYEDGVSISQESVDKVESFHERQFIASHLALTQTRANQEAIPGYAMNLTRVYINGRPVPKVIYRRFKAETQESVDKIESFEERQSIATHLAVAQVLANQGFISGYPMKPTRVYINGRPVPS